MKTKFLGYRAKTVDAAGETCEFTDPRPSKRGALSILNKKRDYLRSKDCNVQVVLVYEVQETLKREVEMAEGSKVVVLPSTVDIDETLTSLQNEVAMWRRLYLDKPEDRLWHDSDKTWWSRKDDSRYGVGGLFSAAPPEPVQKLEKENARLRAKLSKLTEILKERG